MLNYLVVFLLFFRSRAIDRNLGKQRDLFLSGEVTKSSWCHFVTIGVI